MLKAFVFTYTRFSDLCSTGYYDDAISLVSHASDFYYVCDLGFCSIDRTSTCETRVPFGWFAGWCPHSHIDVLILLRMSFLTPVLTVNTESR